MKFIYANKKELKQSVLDSKNLSPFNKMYWYTQLDYTDFEAAYPNHQILNERIQKDIKIIKQFKKIQETYRNLGIEILKIVDLKESPEIPKDILEFFKNHNLNIDISDLTAYDVKDNIIYTGIITNEDGVYIKWEKDPNINTPNSYIILGDFVDSL